MVRPVALLARLVGLLVLLAGCEASSLEWHASFATEALQLRASSVRYTIERGSCAVAEPDRQIVWSAEAEPAGAIGAPGDLGPGAYAFRVVARDDRCTRFAQGCREATLPRDGARLDVLVGHVAPASICEAGQSCIEGLCRSDLRLPRWSCPEGWAPVAVPDPTLGSIAVCEPFARRLDCPDGTWQLPGERLCTAPGLAACSDVVAGGWPRDVPSGALHVLAGEESSGDGTRAAPLRDLATVLADAPDGTTVVALGTYALDRLVVPRGVTLLGSCARTRIVLADPQAPSDDPDATTVKVYGGALRNLYVTGGSPAVRVVGSGTLDGVVVEGSHGLGILVDSGAQLTADLGGGLVVRGTMFSSLVEPSRNRGHGLSVGGRSASLARFVSENNEGAGLSIRAGAVVGVEKSLVRRNVGSEAVVIAGSSADISRVVVEDGTINCDGSLRCDLEDVVVRGRDGRGFSLSSDQGDLGVQRGWLVGPIIVAAYVLGGTRAPSSAGDLSNAILRDVVIQTAPGARHAVEAVDAGDLLLERFVVSGGDRCAISIEGALRPSFVDGVILHSAAGVCADVTPTLDRCGVSVLDVARATRVSGPVIETCDGCDADGDGIDDLVPGEAACPDPFEAVEPACRTTPRDGSTSETVVRCCIPMPQSGCDAGDRYHRVLTPVGAEGQPLAPECCTW